MTDHYKEGHIFETTEEIHGTEHKETRVDTHTTSTMTFTLAQKILGFVICLGTLFGNYVVTKALTDYRIIDIEKKIDKNAIKIEFMDANGHPPHERRITALEAIHSEITVRDVNEHSKQISLLADTVSKDHDLLVRVVTMMELDRRKAQ